MTKTIGVLGGMGPYATLDFMRLMLDQTAVKKESDHLRVLIDNNPGMPSRTRAYLFREADPVPDMKRAVELLSAAGADFIVVPCNSAHYFLPRVFDGLSIPYIDMVEVTSSELIEKGLNRVGILAGEVTVGARLYENFLAPRGIDVIQVDGENQESVRRIIEDVKNNKIGTSTKVLTSRLVDYLVTRDVQAIVLGCTELQAVVRDTQFDIEFFDSAAVLARAAIINAGGTLREASEE